MSQSNVLLKEVLGIFHRLVIVLGNSLQTANVSLRWKMQSQITQWIPDAKQNILLMFYLSTHIHVFTVCNETKKKVFSNFKKFNATMNVQKEKIRQIVSIYASKIHTEWVKLRFSIYIRQYLYLKNSTFSII